MPGPWVSLGVRTSERSARLRGTHPPALLVRVHFYAQGVDGGVHDHPGAPPELRGGWDVDEDRLFVLPETVHDVGSELQHLVVHVCRAKQSPGEEASDPST